MEALVILLLVVGGSLLLYRRLNAGEVLCFETFATPRQATMAAVGIVAVRRRWMTLGQDEGSATFAYYDGPSKLLLVPLLLLFLLPGAVYWIVAARNEALAVRARRPAPGMTVVEVSSHGWRGKSAGRELRAQLGLAATRLGQPVGPQTRATSSRV